MKRKQRNKSRKSNNRFKKLKLKKEKRKEKEKGKKRKTPQNCKNPTQRQRFMATIKNVSEEENKQTNKQKTSET